jgi:hypothetical protein
MKSYRALASASAAVVAFALSFGLSPAKASIVYDFHGTCTTVCEGEVYAEFLLSDDYVPGAHMACGWPALCQLQRLRYIDNTTIEDFDFTARSAAGLLLEPNGFIDFPALSGPGFAGFGINGGTTGDLPFRAHLDGTWEMFTPVGWDTRRLAGGINGTFELAAHEFIPEPSTGYLFLAAIFVFTLSARIQGKGSTVKAHSRA